MSALAGTVAVSGVSSAAHTPGTTAAAGSVHIQAENVANVNFPQVHWNIDTGSEGYRKMLRDLDELARTTANARLVGPIVNTRGNRVNIYVTDNTKTNKFADIVIEGSGEMPAVHAVVRLSDFYVVRFYTMPAEGRDGHQLNLVRGIPNEDANATKHFLGRENYNALGQEANTALEDVRLGPSQFANSAFTLARSDSSTRDQASAMLTFIFGISEAARFRPIQDRIAASMDSWSYTQLTRQQTELIRNWARISHVFVGHNNGTDTDASTSVAGATIADARQAAALLEVALNDGFNPNPKDEL
ncbi:ribosome-inactivating family protein [Streptomyces olindensis]|uniref:ribosome-inactivating family protein n=1 Tax=Streptomyces olindensis TaxID=358823 RepID=UPI00340FAA01